VEAGPQPGDVGLTINSLDNSQRRPASSFWRRRYAKGPGHWPTRSAAAAASASRARRQAGSPGRKSSPTGLSDQDGLSSENPRTAVRLTERSRL
jgi:hypothetical protein